MICVAVREEFTRVSSRHCQLTLPGQRALVPPIYCSYLPSFLWYSIDSLRLLSMRILTYSNVTDRTADVIHIGLTFTKWGWPTARLCLGKWLFGVPVHAVSTKWLFGVAVHADSTKHWVNWSYKGEMLRKSVVCKNWFIQPSPTSIHIFRNVLLVVQFLPQLPQRPLPLHAVYRFLHIHCKNTNERLHVNATERHTLLIPLD